MSTITLVTSSLTLVAFLIAAVAGGLRAWLRHRERQLLAAPMPARAALVQALNNSFLITARPLSTTKLSADQAYDLLLAQLRARSDRFKHTSIVIIVIALIGGVVMIFAMTRPVAGTGPASVMPAPATSSTAAPSDSGIEMSASTDHPTVETSTVRGASTPPPTRLPSLDRPQDTTTYRGNTAPNPDPLVTYNHQSRIYHCPTCSRATACTTNCTEITLSEALRHGARACKICDGTCN